MRSLTFAFVMAAGAAMAAPDTSLRPVERDGAGAQEQQPAAIDQPSRDAATEARGLARSLRPEVRPRKFRRIARAQERLRKKGAVCGDVDIQGVVVGRVPGAKAGCGISDAVRIRAVSGIGLSQLSIMDCGTAKALKTWIDDTAKPAFSRKGGGLKNIRVAAHYACRTRNNQPGGRISEHGKGRAIDISGLQMRDGTLVTVRNGWNNPAYSTAMRQLHRGACGPFGTVLGPESDRFHRDHFHFDTARYRSGPYCR